MRYDVAIIGGGVAGLQAALTLARSLYRVAVIDAGMPRHRFAPQMHNLLGADGADPASFYARAWAQLAAYPDVTRVEGMVVDGEAEASFGFRLLDGFGQSYCAATVLFACGMVDLLPPIPGIADLWGSTVQHCAYCHGYEARGKSIAALTTTAQAWTMVELLGHLTPKLHLLLEDGAPDAALAARLAKTGIGYGTHAATRVEPQGNGLRIHLTDGTRYDCEVLYLQPGQAPSSSLPAKFGCTVNERGQIVANEWGFTGIAGIYAAGDVIAGRYSQLAAALKSGLDAATMIHADLTRARFAGQAMS